MLTAHYELGADEKPAFDEAYAKKKFEEAIKSGDPVKYAAQAGAAAACGAIGGGYAAALCALGAGALWDKLFGPDCGDLGGREWCLAVCTDVRYYSGTISRYCVGRQSIQPTLVADLPDKQYSNVTPGTCVSTYCQLPSMPEPVYSAPSTADSLLERWAKGHAAGAQELAPIYPTGSITAQDKQGMWHVAAPGPAALSGASDPVYHEIALTPTRPAVATELPFLDYLKRTGQLPWYKNWRTWAIAGGVAATGVAGVLLWKRRQRRKRR